MNVGWRECTVRDFIDRGEVELRTGPFGTQLHASDYVEQGTPVINVRNIGYGSIRREKLEFIADETVQRLASHLLEPGDIVFGRKGAVERHAFIREAQDGWFQGSDCLRLRFKSPDVEPRFASYCFLTEAHKQWMVNQCSHGATMSSLNQDIVSRIPLKLPAFSTQRKIAGILSAYDDLIENNTRRIQILEEMAQAIYREWFVHFRFPGHEGVEMVDSELGFVPAGWEMKKVGNIVKRLRAGKRYKRKEVAETGNVPVISQSQDEFLGFHDNDPDHQAAPEKPTIIFGDHTCKMQLMIQPFSVGPNVVPFVSKDAMSVQYLFFLARDLVETREYKRHWRELTSKKVVVAPDSLTEKFAALITPMLEQMDVLQQKNLVLRQTRDLLLPRLVSGEVDVSELEVGSEPLNH